MSIKPALFSCRVSLPAVSTALFATLFATLLGACGGGGGSGGTAPPVSGPVPQQPAPAALTLTAFASGLNAPTYLTAPPGDSRQDGQGELYLLTDGGAIWKLAPAP